MSTGDPEIDAMTMVAAALAPLDVEGQGRVIKWAAGRFGVALEAAKPVGRAVRRTPTKSQADNEDAEPVDVDVDEGEVMSAVAEHTGVDLDKLEKLFHIDGGFVKLLVNHTALGNSVSEKAKNTARIITVVRKIGMGHAETSFDLIRQECERKHYYDAKNFAYKHMATIDGFAVKGDGRGNKRLEARNSGINAFGALVDRVMGGA